MEILFEKYENIQKCLKNYRKYTVKEPFYDFKTFKKHIQVEQYIRHKCMNQNNKPVYVYLFKDQSIYIKTTAQFRRLMDKISGEPADVIIISKNELSVYIKKAFIVYKSTLNIFNYLHKTFAIELSEGPLCSPHTILSNNEVRTLCSQDLIVHPLSLPSLSINDPQNIWIGGELGQVVKIESISEITGKTIRYRIISPDSGTILNIQKLKTAPDEDTTDTIDTTSKEGIELPEKKNKPETVSDNMSEYIDEDEDQESETGED